MFSKMNLSSKKEKKWRSMKEALNYKMVINHQAEEQYGSIAFIFGIS
jgi:hypothetical protein